MSKNRYYVNSKNQVLPSVSEITSQINKPGLLYFYGKYGTEKAQEIGNQAKQTGTELHSYIHHTLSKPKDKFELHSVNPAILKNLIAGFDLFRKEYKLEPIVLEKAVQYNGDFPFAGTLDYFGYANEFLVLNDWKTSKDFYVEYELNAEAYYACLLQDLELNKLIVEALKNNKFKLMLTSFSKDKPGFKVKFFEPSDERFQAFQGLNRLWYFVNGSKPEKEIYAKRSSKRKYSSTRRK
ncbi:MAG: hypothetical protein ACHQ1D_00685 [Nitrososphaerales archaeon]